MTDKTQIDNIKAKVGKMLSLASDSGASQGEIENALSMATQMMMKYNLTRQDIDQSKENPIEKVQYGMRTAYSLSKKTFVWESSLAMFLTRFIGTVKVYRDSQMHLNRKRGMVVTDEKGNSVYSRAFIFYGSDDDCEIAVELFDELKYAIQMSAIIRFGSWAKGDGGAYCEGFVSGLRQTHIQEVKKLKMDSQTYGLIIVSEQNQLAIVKQADQWLAKEKGVKLYKKQTSTGASGSSDARNEGREDGSNYGLNKPTATRKLA
jgi:hypothetical protein